MEYGELRNPLEHRPSQSHSDLGRSTSAESSDEEALETFVREEELNFEDMNSKVPAGNKLVISYLTINIILPACDSLANSIIEGLQQIQGELLNQLQFHREFQETVSSRQETLGRLREANDEGPQEENSKEEIRRPSTLHRGPSEEDKKEVRKSQCVKYCELTFSISGLRTPSQILRRKKMTPRRGSLNSSAPRVLTQFFCVISLVRTSNIFVISSNLVNSVKLIISQLGNKLYFNNPGSHFIKIFYRGKLGENSAEDPPGEDSKDSVNISQVPNQNSKPPGSHYTQTLPQPPTRLQAAERTTHHGHSSIKCIIYLYHVSLFLLLLSPKTRNYYARNCNQNVT